MASTIISKLENRSKSNPKIKTTSTTNSNLIINDDNKPYKEIVNQPSKKSNYSQSLSALKKQNYKEEPNEEIELRPDYVDLTPTSNQHSNPPQTTNNQTDVSPLKNVIKQHRMDFYGTIISKKGNKHKVSFIDKIGKGELESVVSIKRAVYEESSKNLGPITSGGQSRVINLDSEAKDKLGGDNCTCICIIF